MEDKSNQYDDYKYLDCLNEIQYWEKEFDISHLCIFCGVNSKLLTDDFCKNCITVLDKTCEELSEIYIEDLKNYKKYSHIKHK